MAQFVQVIRELVVNAVKHAKPNCIQVKIQEEKGIFTICIKNNGKISPKTEWYHGKGVKNIERRIRLLNGQVFWDVTQQECCATIKINL
ncbi:MAG: ATP-binding protein [Pseudomonadales bacterium]|nr:ATP-binding protein [Pseudomonadales bacterium]